MKCRWLNSRRVQSDSQITVAVRGPWSSKESSPTTVPGPNEATFLPLRLTITEPSSTTKASRPVCPWSTIREPAGMMTSSPALAIFSRSFCEHAENNETLRRWSRYAFLLAIAAECRHPARGDRTELRDVPSASGLGGELRGLGGHRVGIAEVGPRHNLQCRVELVLAWSARGDVQLGDVASRDCFEVHHQRAQRV